MTAADEALAPRRRVRRDEAPAPQDYDEAEIARGSSAALLGALGRMQLKLDVMARQHEADLARLEAKVDALAATLDSLTVVEE